MTDAERTAADHLNKALALMGEAADHLGLAHWALSKDTTTEYGVLPDLSQAKSDLDDAAEAVLNCAAVCEGDDEDEQAENEDVRPDGQFGVGA